jgi:hypothetical protein
MPLSGIAPIPVVPVHLPHVLPLFQQPPLYQGPAYGALQGPNLIGMDDNESIANVFCFGAFADKNNGVVYNDLTGSFPFISLDGSICFFVMYHYKANAILAKAISGLDNISIFNAYKRQFKDLTSKGFKPKINIMYNQATKHIKVFLTEQQCKLQLVEPHNHRMNAAEKAIQTFKDAFIAALATTENDFPLQLWDKIMPQVQDTLNLMQASQINPAISADKALNGLYDWNQCPLAPLGCKAVVYKAGNTRGSWALQGVAGWYLSPLMDHYRCALYYIAKTQAFQILGSTKLFPQHCQMPNMTPHQHFRALTDELAELTAIASATDKGQRLIKLLQSKIKDILHPPVLVHPPQAAQRVRVDKHRVIDEPPILNVSRITDAPPIMQVQNPTAKRVLKITQQIHWRLTWNNTPGGIPLIKRVHPILEEDTQDRPPMTSNAHPSQQHLLRKQQKPTTPLPRDGPCLRKQLRA